MSDENNTTTAPVAENKPQYTVETRRVTRKNEQGQNEVEDIPVINITRNGVTVPFEPASRKKTAKSKDELVYPVPPFSWVKDHIKEFSAFLGEETVVKSAYNWFRMQAQRYAKSSGAQSDSGMDNAVFAAAVIDLATVYESIPELKAKLQDTIESTYELLDKDEASMTIEDWKKLKALQCDIRKINEQIESQRRERKENPDAD